MKCSVEIHDRNEIKIEEIEISQRGYEELKNAIDNEISDTFVIKGEFYRTYQIKSLSIIEQDVTLNQLMWNFQELGKKIEQFAEQFKQHEQAIEDQEGREYANFVINKINDLIVAKTLFAEAVEGVLPQE